MLSRLQKLGHGHIHLYCKEKYFFSTYVLYFQEKYKTFQEYVTNKNDLVLKNLSVYKLKDNQLVADEMTHKFKFSRKISYHVILMSYGSPWCHILVIAALLCMLAEFITLNLSKCIFLSLLTFRNDILLHMTVSTEISYQENVIAIFASIDQFKRTFFI